MGEKRVNDISVFLKSFTSWASVQPDIRAAALVGSYARDAANETSDVDLLILTTGVARYIRDQSWVSAFGQVLEHRIEDWGKVKSLRVFYEGGVEVEYGFSAPDWADPPMDAGSLSVVAGGMTILFDPQGVLATVQREVLSRGTGRGSSDLTITELER